MSRFSERGIFKKCYALSKIFYKTLALKLQGEKTYIL